MEQARCLRAQNQKVRSYNNRGTNDNRMRCDVREDNRFRGDFRDDRWNTSYNGNARQKGRPKCYECNRYGYFATECTNRTRNTQQNDSGSRNQNRYANRNDDRNPNSDGRTDTCYDWRNRSSNNGGNWCNLRDNNEKADNNRDWRNNRTGDNTSNLLKQSEPSSSSENQRSEKIPFSFISRRQSAKKSFIESEITTTVPELLFRKRRDPEPKTSTIEYTPSAYAARAVEEPRENPPTDDTRRSLVGVREAHERKFLFDSGSTDHLTGDLDGLENVRKLQFKTAIRR